MRDVRKVTGRHPEVGIRAILSSDRDLLVLSDDFLSEQEDSAAMTTFECALEELRTAGERARFGNR